MKSMHHAKRKAAGFRIGVYVKDYLSAPRINVFQENFLQDEQLCRFFTTGKWVKEVREGTTQPRSHRQVCKDQQTGLERTELTTRDSDPCNPGDTCFHSGTLYSESNPDFCYSEREEQKTS